MRVRAWLQKIENENEAEKKREDVCGGLYFSFSFSFRRWESEGGGNGFVIVIVYYYYYYFRTHHRFFAVRLVTSKRNFLFRSLMMTFRKFCEILH